ncbi:ribulose-phosphate 3-epimerase [Enterobacteriaceae endosymbiont of Plateumaris braccata]|uniref:ribulose-phosphate 3-epimerase n=1 Tax=Enterobacteriaceae endosymbiont of Plateumaris braccata TaxID=2675793 RepID=UPI0014495595|nr:ribulose-phosphate 3-epimerase [Enterobacteriaceae endosymbiont of Plateumaris braccata]QJC28298.1 ribulose-phosphate 3-epimerase [Enterobacteriaceae endosymbiont of Plateumaris braccata]
MNKYFLAASILSANFSYLGKEINDVIIAGVDIIHFDIMDNHYVPNLTIGPLVLKSLRDCGITNLIDVHLMTKPVDNLIISCAQAGADYITFHPECSYHIDRSISLIKEYGCKAGLAFNPSTSLDYLDYIIDKLDIILIMSVNPGFEGQKFIPKIFNKIIKARKIIDQKQKNILLSVDGGVNIQNISKIISSGANVLVLGSTIFKNILSYKEVIKQIKIKLNNII